MPISKPTKLPEWADGPAGPPVLTEPAGAKKQQGWIVGELPAAEYWNWIWNNTYTWIQWLNDITNQALSWTVQQAFQAGIVVSGSSGAGATGIDATGGPGGNSIGVWGRGIGTGSGVAGTGQAGTAGPGVAGLGGSNGGPGLTGNGGGAGGSGVVGSGGAGNGYGGSFIGGNTNGIGVGASGTGTGGGVWGTGGTGGGYGVFGQGDGGATGGNGVRGIGGGSSGTLGVWGTGGPSGIGVRGDGTGIGSGVQGNGAAGSSATGVDGHGGSVNGVGVAGAGAGSGAGGSFTGGGTSGGDGVVAIAGGVGTTGVRASGGANRGAVNLVPQGAPGFPVDGDIWVETAGSMKAKANGSARFLTDHEPETVVSAFGGSSPAFGANWSMNGTSVQFYRDNAGTVHLSGGITSTAGNDGTTIFTFPSGYHPITTRSFPCGKYVSAFGMIVVTISSSGVVNLATTTRATFNANDSIVLDGISFEAV